MQPLLKLIIPALVLLTPFVANAQDEDRESCASFANLSQQHVIELIGENAPAPDGRLERLTWSPDGTQIAVGVMNGEQERIQIWDLEREVLVTTLDVDEQIYWLFDFQWSPDGSHIAATYYNGTPQIWDAERGWARLALDANAPIIGEVVWSPDSEQLAIRSQDITLWSAEDGRLLQTFDAGSGDSLTDGLVSVHMMMVCEKPR
jgi:WD40 repeat protein